MKTARYKVIACKVLMRELYSLAAASKAIVDITWLRQGLHNTPDQLRREVQAEIDKAEAEETEYDAIILGYCLCSNGIVGLTSKKYPLVVAKGHDCITLLLGSKERYHDLFFGHSGGIYWYSPGWIEQTMMPGKQRYDAIYRSYAEKYGEDNAQYLMDMEQNWMKEYGFAIHIKWPGLPGQEEYAQYTRECADFLGWKYEAEEGSNILLKKLIDGEWCVDEVLVVPPGMTIKPSFDDEILSSGSMEELDESILSSNAVSGQR